MKHIDRRVLGPWWKLWIYRSGGKGEREWAPLRNKTSPTYSRSTYSWNMRNVRRENGILRWWMIYIHIYISRMMTAPPSCSFGCIWKPEPRRNGMLICIIMAVSACMVCQSANIWQQHHQFSLLKRLFHGPDNKMSAATAGLLFQNWNFVFLPAARDEVKVL